MKNLLIKYKLYFLSFAFVLAYAISYTVIFYQDYEAIVSRFNTKITEYEQKLDRVATLKLKETLKSGTFTSWKQQDSENEFAIHIYKNDSLLYWNTNHIPVSRFADIHFPSEGINHLQNGWYFTKVKSANGYTVAATILVKSEYPYQNEHLINGFSSKLGFPISAQIIVDKDSPHRVYNTKNEYLFSVVPSEKQIPQDGQAFILLFLLMGAIALFIMALYHSFKESSLKYAWFVPMILILVRGISLNYSKSFFDNDVAIFSNKFFYINDLFPNFFEYLVNVFLIVFIVNCLIRYIK